MKRIKSKRVIAAILAILTTLCLSTGALAAEAVNPSGMMNNNSFSGKAPSFQPSGEMGQMPELPNGEAPADAPELPEGEAPGFQPSGEMGQMPELPNGEVPADAPALPEGEAPSVEPSGEMGQPPELPNGEAPADAPELPEGEAPNFQPSGEMGQLPELPNGEAPADAPELPEGETPNFRPSGEMGQPGGAPAEQNNRGNIRDYIQQLINALQQLLGGPRDASGLVQVSPAFEAATQNSDASARSDRNA